MTDAHDKPEPDPAPELEPESDPAPESASQPTDPLPLEPDAAADEASEGSSRVADLDVCPNCGAPMRGRDEVLCLRCGFDLKTLTVVETGTGIAAVEPESGRDERPPIVLAHWTDRRVIPIAIAIALLALAIMALAGYRGLFPTIAGDAEILWPVRLRYVVRMLVLIALWGSCGMIAVGLGARLFERTPGDWVATLVRLLAVIVAARLVTLIDLPSAPLEFILELVGQAVVLVGLTMALLRLKVRDAAIIVGIQATAFIALYAVAHLIVWPSGLSAS